MPPNPLADEVWRQMSTLVLDNKDRWRRSVVERTGLPFSRIRILRRLARHSMTVKEIAEAATVDAPAATVAVNDLERRGLVVRRVDAMNRRCKVVTLTDAGRDVVAAIEEVDDPAPTPLADLSNAQLSALQTIFAEINATAKKCE
jgi:DNA-binding MarR family transcriptional regulator